MTTSSNPFDIFGDDADFTGSAPQTNRETLTRTRDEFGFVPPSTFSFEEACTKCNGTGKFRTYSGRVLGNCFECKGQGKKSFKSSPEQREKGRERAAVKRIERETEKQAAIEAFKTEHAAVWAWFKDNEKAAKPFEFATNLFNALCQYGHLTERQLAAAQNCVAKREAARAKWQAEKAAQNAAAPGVGVEALTALTEALDRARKAKANQELVFAGHRVYPPTSGRWVGTGTVYVKAGRTYIGRVTDSKFVRGQDATDAQVEAALELLRDPAAAAIRHGLNTKQCSCCGHKLTKEESILRGIGPVCAEKWGF